jgi:phosphoribosylaminoimidazole-succinocarboxamide synthase
MSFYKGKVRDVYSFNNKIVMITTNRISCFDYVLPDEIPDKGAVLNKISAFFLNKTKDLVPNWLESTPHPNVMIGKKCKPIMVEMIIRGYLVGHAWREYKKGKRILCGVKLPDNMKEYDRFPNPIITPTTKDEHDEDITKEEILEKKLATPEQYEKMEKYTKLLFSWGQGYASGNNQVYLIDEVLTPDSSRYFYQNNFKQQLSKEFVRDWLRDNGFDGTKGSPPKMPKEFIEEVRNKYINLYQIVTGDESSDI